MIFNALTRLVQWLLCQSGEHSLPSPCDISDFSVHQCEWCWRYFQLIKNYDKYYSTFNPEWQEFTPTELPCRDCGEIGYWVPGQKKHHEVCLALRQRRKEIR